MTVKDLKEGMTCTLISARKNNKFESKKTIRIVDKYSVFVDITVWEGKIVNLNGASNHLAIDMNGQEPQVFQYIFPEIYVKGGKRYYRIDLRNRHTVKYNRRHNSRCPIEKSVHARMNKAAETYPCLLKDISAVGFALEFRKRELPPGYKDAKTFQCVFTDADMTYRIKTTFELNGVVRRIVEKPDDIVLIGCETPYSSVVDKYVEQKLEVRRKRRSR